MAEYLKETISENLNAPLTQVKDSISSIFNSGKTYVTGKVTDLMEKAEIEPKIEKAKELLEDVKKSLNEGTQDGSSQKNQ